MSRKASANLPVPAAPASETSSRPVTPGLMTSDDEEQNTSIEAANASTTKTPTKKVRRFFSAPCWLTRAGQKKKNNKKK
jgi:hypothetical protein